MPATIRAIFFDFDGTLVDSEPLHHECWSEAVRPFGAAVGWEDYQRRFVGVSDRAAGRTLLTEAGHHPSEELLKRVCDAKHSAYRARCPALAITDEICTSIHYHSSHLPLGVVSSSITLEVQPVLEKAAIQNSLKVVVCGQHLARFKPDPEPYLLALRLLDNNSHSIRAEHCLVFEDSDAGMAAATNAGMRVRRVAAPEQLPELLRDELG